MGSSENGLVTMLRTYQVSGNSEGYKTFCNRCKKRMASRVEGSHGVQSDKNVNKTDLQSYIYQTSNREPNLGAIVLIWQDLSPPLHSTEFILWRFIARISLNVSLRDKVIFRISLDFNPSYNRRLQNFYLRNRNFACSLKVVRRTQNISLSQPVAYFCQKWNVKITDSISRPLTVNQSGVR